jgi:hypothetical protein
MVGEALKSNVRDLQKDVVELLEEISKLMYRASLVLGNDSVDNKYTQYQQQVSNEAHKVQNLELRMAIVAPMKAGKSTITNAIVGQEILPSRNSAMTTLPTEIIFDAELTEPVLHLSSEVLSVFQETLLSLRDKIENLKMEQVKKKLAQYPHLAKMPQQILKSVGDSIPAKSEGCKNIIHTLTSLNDIVRLCSILDEPQADPIQYLIDAPRIYTPFWRLQKVKAQLELGKLVIVDTPGPNEAGENLRLQAVVAEQLRKSSIVLIVLDFTQLKNEAAEKVKKDVQKVIDLRGKDNLYVLINKVDQRRDGDMSPKEVQQFVAAEFGIGDANKKNQVFEISARRALTSANFLMELQKKSHLNIVENKAARALAQELFGIRWETRLQKESINNLQEEAEYLWEESGFNAFLNGAINALIEQAAPLCMESALKMARGMLEELNNEVQLRKSGNDADQDKLKLEVQALEADLQSLSHCRNRLQEVDKLKTNLYQQLNNILEKLQQDAKVSLETYFTDEEYQRGNALKKGGMILQTGGQVIQSFFSRFSKRFQCEIKPTGTGVIEFKNLREAEDFTEQAIAYPREKINALLDSVREQVRKIIEHSHQELTHLLEEETKPIIERARDRLNESFNVNLSLPTPRLDSKDINFAKPSIKHNTRWIDQGYETQVVKKRKWYYLWLFSEQETIQVKRPDKKEEYYTVSLQEIVNESNKKIEQNIKNIKQGINQYLDEDFKQQIDICFTNLNNYLSNYRNSLTQAQKDKTLKAEERENLVMELTSLVLESREKIQKSDNYLQYTENFNRDK